MSKKRGLSYFERRDEEDDVEDDEENEDDDGDLNWSHPPHTRRPHTATHHSVPL